MNEKIPAQLQKENFGFCKITSGTKKPFETGWQEKPYKYNDSQLVEHLKNGGNYGIISGYGNLRILDVDDIDQIAIFDKLFGDTFAVETPSGGRHYYFLSDYGKNHVLKYKVGELRCCKMQCVGPNCELEGDKRYKIVNDTSLKTYTKEDIENNLWFYIGTGEGETSKVEKKEVDTSRSGKEFAEVCRLIKKGKSKEEIFNDMMSFAKWANAPEQYREHTYKKALAAVDDDRYEQSTINDESLKNLTPQNFEYFCSVVRGLYHSRKPKKVKQGEDLVVKYILNNYHIHTPEDTKKDIFIYDDGIYEPNGETFLGKLIEIILAEENTNHYTIEILGHIMRRTYIKRDNFIEPLHLICLKNGLLNIETMGVEEFTPTHIFLNKITPLFDKNATCPNIEKFLREVLIKREDWSNSNADITDLQTMREFIGYLLYKKIIFNRAVMLYGDGENGKSTCINLIKKFLGDKNVSNIAIQKLESNNFAVAALQGKLANLHSDLPKTALKETSKFKQLTGGDSVNAEKKFKDTFSFVPYAKMMFAANTLPATYDDTRAFWRRWLIFWFPNIFEEKKDDTRKNILDELTTEEELSGLLNWAIEGLKRLLANKRFTINKSTGQIREEYIRKSDSIGAFVLDMVEESPGSFIFKRDLYEVYALYCRQRAYDIVSENTFHRRFYQKVNVREYHPKIDSGKQKPAWSGIKFKDKSKELKDDGSNGSFEDESDGDSDLDDWVD